MTAETCFPSESFWLKSLCSAPSLSWCFSQSSNHSCKEAKTHLLFCRLKYPTVAYWGRVTERKQGVQTYFSRGPWDKTSKWSRVWGGGWWRRLRWEEGGGWAEFFLSTKRSSFFAGGPAGSHNFNMRSSFALCGDGIDSLPHGGGFHSERAASLC